MYLIDTDRGAALVKLGASGSFDIRLIVALVVAMVAAPASAQKLRRQPSGVEATIDRGLVFLAKDALAWKKKHNCVSCHHAGLVIWSMHEAKEGGHAVAEPLLAELTKWVAESGDGKTGPAPPANAPKRANTKAVQLALALGAVPKPDAVSRKGLNLLLQTVASDQTENGSWSTSPEFRPPIYGNSDECMTALATLAVLPAAATGDDAAKVVRDQGVKWLAATKTDGDPQSIALRLVLWQRLGRPPEEWQPLARRIKERQNADGGWSQTKDMASDAWATGQALYALAHAGIKPGERVITRAHAFLVKTQRADGSWPMTSRPRGRTPRPEGPDGSEVVHPQPADAAGSKSLIPITGAGSAWAVLGLVRSR